MNGDGELVRDDTVFLHLPPLPAGEYTFDASNFFTVDLAGNVGWLGFQTVPFTVSETAPTTTYDRFDINRDNVVNLADLQTLSMLLHWDGIAHHLDTNQDGSVTRADYDFLARQVLGLRPGDVDLDGDFDQHDLDLLGDASKFGTAASWTEGDFDGDGWFTARDLVLAMTEGWFDVGDDRVVRKRIVKS